MRLPNWMSFDERMSASPILRSLVQDMSVIEGDHRNWKRFGWVCVVIVVLSVVKNAPYWVALAAIGGQILALFAVIKLKKEHKNRVAKTYRELMGKLGEKSGRRLCAELQIREDGSTEG